MRRRRVAKKLICEGADLQRGRFAKRIANEENCEGGEGGEGGLFAKEEICEEADLLRGAILRQIRSFFEHCSKSL